MGKRLFENRPRSAGKPARLLRSSASALQQGGFDDGRRNTVWISFMPVCAWHKRASYGFAACSIGGACFDHPFFPAPFNHQSRRFAFSQAFYEKFLFLHNADALPYMLPLYNFIYHCNSIVGVADYTLALAVQHKLLTA